MQQNPFFPEINGQFGFGMMRLPMIGEEVDIAQTTRMVDHYMANGYNYFDTAHGYLSGLSEAAIKTCIADRYPREKFVLVNKLSYGLFEESPEGIRRYFDMQLKACGVDYFDFYLMHAQSAKIFPAYKACHAYETVGELMKEGKVRHLGISFHDTAEVLDQILTEYPQIELVQIQYNYLDKEDAQVQARLCYEVCERHGKPIVAMEPVKGGRLANLPKAAQDVLNALDGEGSYASYAVRYVASFPQIAVTLSGMSTIGQVEDNVATMLHIKPLEAREFNAVYRVADILHQEGIISCTNCRYCVDGCPSQILIPDHFAAANAKKLGHDATAPEEGGQPADCIHCGACEQICPQHLKIRDLLETLV